MEGEDKGLIFIRVGVWGRLKGRAELVAEFVGGPLAEDPGDIRARAALGLGQESASPYQTESNLAPHFRGKELSAAVTLDFDLDALGGVMGGRMSRFADLWGRGLSQEFQAAFVQVSGKGVEESRKAWGRLLAESERAALREAAGEGELEAGPGRGGRRI